MKKTIKKIDKITDEIATNVSIKLIGKLGSAAAGFIAAGPPGVVISIAVESAIEDIAKRLLSLREASRMEKVIKQASKVYDELSKKSPLRKDFDKEKYEELFEGLLLKARESYEEKKIPLLGNLFATTPFTNTPIENINQTLITAEQLSYRQLCILAVIGQNEWNGALKLSERPIKEEYKDKFSENTWGIYHDIFLMVALGIVVQMYKDSQTIDPLLAIGKIIPNNLKLHYPGRLLFNGMRLDTIDKRDTNQVINILR